jgi:general secretion pathway protein A
MYQQYFGLSESPFSIAPDPRYLFLSDKHREALAHLIYGVGDQGGFVLLTGEVGTGKTTICRCLLQQVPDNADVAFIINPRQSINQLLQSVCKDLGIGFDKGLTSKELIDQLNDYLLESHARGRNTILLIDEAQNLSVDVLEQLRLLTNLETNEKKLLQLVLLGQPELNELLARQELRQLAQRVTARYHLSPLSRAEVTEYIQHRLSVAGCRLELFPSAAIKKIYQLSGGVPRLINLICDRTLLGVYATSSAQASPKIVANAAKEVFPPKAGHRRKPVWLAVVVAVLVLLVAVGWKQLLFQSDAEPALAATSNAEADTQALTPATLPDNTAGIASVSSTENIEITETTEHNESKQLEAIAGQTSLADLLRLWGLAESQEQSDCSQSQLGEELYCINTLANINQLLSYNVPAALQLQSPAGSIVNALLRSVDGDQASLISPQGNFSLSLAELADYRIVSSVVFTRLHPDLQLPIAPGDSSAMIGWLQRHWLPTGQAGSDLPATAMVDSLKGQKPNKSALLYAHYLVFPATAASTVYQQPLISTVKQLQRQLGLAPTAIIDYPLLAALSHKRHQSDPVLVTPAAEEG